MVQLHSHQRTDTSKDTDSRHLDGSPEAHHPEHTLRISTLATTSTTAPPPEAVEWPDNEYLDGGCSSTVSFGAAKVSISTAQDFGSLDPLDGSVPIAFLKPFYHCD